MKWEMKNSIRTRAVTRPFSHVFVLTPAPSIVLELGTTSQGPANAKADGRSERVS